jgi:MSHA biogenesis protein MshI
MINFLRRSQSSARRTGVACSPRSFAIATVSRSKDGRCRLDSCLSAAASRDEQSVAVGDWLSAADHQQGAVSGVLDAADYELLHVEAPDVLPAEFKAAVRWRLKGVIDFPVEDAVIDVFDMPEQPHRAGAKKMLYVAAAQRHAIERQAQILKPAAARFDVIDIPELALRNLAALLPEAADGLIILWLTGNSAQLIGIKETTLYFARHVHLAGHDAADSAADLPDVDAIALEVQRSNDYFESQYQQVPPANLIIAPCSERSVRLAQALAKHTSMRVQSLNLECVLDLAAGLDQADPCSVLAIGAALREDPLKF